MALGRSMVDNRSTSISWLRVFVAGAILPGGGFVYLGRPLIGALAAGCVAILLRFDITFAVVVDGIAVLVSGGMAFQQRNKVPNPMPSLGATVLIAVVLPIVLTVIAGGGYLLLLCGYGQLGNRLLLRAIAFSLLWAWGVAISVPPAILVALLILSSGEAGFLAWSQIPRPYRQGI